MLVFGMFTLCSLGSLLPARAIFHCHHETWADANVTPLRQCWRGSTGNTSFAETRLPQTPFRGRFFGRWPRAGQAVRAQQSPGEGQLANIVHDAMTHYSEVYSQWRVLYNNFFINK